MYRSECEGQASDFTQARLDKVAGIRTSLVVLLAIQSVIALLVAIGFYWYGHSLAPAAAALYGGGIGLATSALLGFRIARAARPGAGLGGLYIGALERFVFVATAFAVGIAVLNLEPVAIIVGFAATQCGYFIAGGLARSTTTFGGPHGG